MAMQLHTKCTYCHAHKSALMAMHTNVHSVPLTHVHITIHQTNRITCTLYALQMESLLCKIKSKPTEPGSWFGCSSKIGWWALMVNCLLDWSTVHARLR